MDRISIAILVAFSAVVVCVGLVTRSGDEGSAVDKITTKEQVVELLSTKEAEIRSVETHTAELRVLLERLRDAAEDLWPELRARKGE